MSGSKGQRNETAYKLVLKLNEIQSDQWDKFDERDYTLIDAALRRAKAEGMREADDIAGDHICETWAECCDCASVIAREIRTRAAQIEEGEHGQA